MSFDHYYHAVADWAQQLRVGPDKFVHVHAGLAIWALAALLLRRPLRSPVPLAVCVAAEIFNEVVDRLYLGRWDWPETGADALATWFWPVALFLLLRLDRRVAG